MQVLAALADSWGNAKEAEGPPGMEIPGDLMMYLEPYARRIGVEGSAWHCLSSGMWLEDASK